MEDRQREKDNQRIDDAIMLFKVEIEGLAHDLKAVHPGWVYGRVRAELSAWLAELESK